MRISIELNKEELESTFGLNNEWRTHFEVVIGKEIFKCHVQNCTMQSTYQLGFHVCLTAEGYSKRQQEISDAKALVNKTKEAHKEAQRKLAELQKDEK